MTQGVPYDDFADIYDAWCDSVPIAAENKTFYVELMTDSAGPVVELGVGNGRICIEVARRGGRVFGVDSSTKILELCRGRAEQAGVADRLTLIHADFRETLVPFELTQRNFSVLSLICENPGVSQSAVSRELGIERSGTVVIVDQLEDRGLVTRNKLLKDRRAYALKASEKGMEVYAQARAAVLAHEERMLDGLSREEVATLLDLIQRVGQKG